VDNSALSGSCKSSVVKVWKTEIILESISDDTNATIFFSANPISRCKVSPRCDSVGMLRISLLFVPSRWWNRLVSVVPDFTTVQTKHNNGVIQNQYWARTGILQLLRTRNKAIVGSRIRPDVQPIRCVIADLCGSTKFGVNRCSSYFLLPNNTHNTPYTDFNQSINLRLLMAWQNASQQYTK